MLIYSTTAGTKTLSDHDNQVLDATWHASVTELDALLDELVAALDCLSADVDTQHVRIVIIELRARSRGWRNHVPLLSRSEAITAALQHCLMMTFELLQEARELRRVAYAQGLRPAPHTRLSN